MFRERPIAVRLARELNDQDLVSVDQDVIFKRFDFPVVGEFLAVVVIGSGWENTSTITTGWTRVSSESLVGLGISAENGQVEIEVGRTFG